MTPCRPFDSRASFAHVETHLNGARIVRKTCRHPFVSDKRCRSDARRYMKSAGETRNCYGEPASCRPAVRTNLLPAAIAAAATAISAVTAVTAAAAAFAAIGARARLAHAE